MLKLRSKMKVIKKLNLSQAESEAWKNLLAATGDRAAVCLAFAARFRLTFSELGEVMGVTSSFAGEMLRADKAPAKRVQTLLEIGFPGFLLPEASKGRGRRVLR